MKISIWISCLLSLATLVSSCKREDPTRWNVDLTAPIAQGKILISDLVPDENINIDQNGLVHFIINENLTDFNIDSLLEIPDTTFVDHISNDFAALTLSPGGLIIPTESGDALMNIPNVQIKELISSSGTLKYELRNFINGDLLAVYSLPKATQNGQSITIEEIMPPGSITNPSYTINEFDLSNYHFDLSGINEDSFNQMNNEISLNVDPNYDSTVELPVQDTIIKTLISFINPKIAYARGYFGQHEFSFDESLAIDQLSGIVEGNLNIQELEVNLSIDNYAGIDAQVVLSELTGKNTQTGVEISLDHEEINNSINITRAIDNNGSVSGQNYSILLNETNSNIVDWIENLPDSLTTSTSIEVNPLGDVSSGNDFIYTEQALEANLMVDMPLCVGIDNIVFVDTLDLDFNFDQDLSGAIYIEIDNSFPLDGTLSLSVVDNDGILSYSVIEEMQIHHGLTSDYYNIDPTENSFEIPITEELLEQLRNNQQMEVRIRLNSINSDVVKFTNANFMDVKIYVEANLEVSYD